MAFIQSLLRQAFALMRDRPLAHKIGAVVLALLVPLLVLSSLHWQIHQRQIDLSQKELNGLHMVQQVMALAVSIERLRTERATAPGSGGMDPSQPSRGVGSAAAGVQESLVGLRTAVAATGDATLARDVELALATVERLVAGPSLSEQRALDAVHGRATNTLRELNLRVAEHYGLLFDPQSQTYLMMDLAVERLMVALDASGRSTAATVQVLQRGEASASDRERVQELSLQARDRLQSVRNRLEALKRVAPRCSQTGYDTCCGRSIDNDLHPSKSHTPRAARSFGSARC
ncbi:MAG: hypothetical protein U5L74_08715 [Ideonella sp.]|nr:hypothetical protein [Ideonella sp.]